MDLLLPLLVFVFCVLGGGLLFTTFLRPSASPAHDALESFTLGLAAQLLALFLLGFGVHLLDAPRALWWAMPPALAAALFIRRTALLDLLSDCEVRAALARWALFAAWGLGLLLCVAVYSGGYWAGDWLEHFQRARFWQLGGPADTRFLYDVYSLGARPPLANVIGGVLLDFSGGGFPRYLVLNTLLGTLLVFPFTLLARAWAPGRARAASAAALVVLLFSPFVAQNLSFGWTRHLTAFWLLLGAHLLLRGLRDPDPDNCMSPAEPESCRWAAEQRGEIASKFRCGPSEGILGEYFETRAPPKDAARSPRCDPNICMIPAEALRDRTLGFLALAAAFLAHYSAGPAIVVALFAYLRLHRRALFTRPFFAETARHASVCGALLALWFGWAAVKMGPSDTFASNTTALSAAHQTPGENISVFLLNIRDTLVPHPLRSPELEPVADQKSPAGRARDFFFNLYQINLPLMFGFGGLGALLLLAARPAPGRSAWALALGAYVVLGIGVHTTRDEMGLGHICLQPLVLIGLARVAALLATTPRTDLTRRLWWAGASIDLALGIILPFALQTLRFGSLHDYGATVLRNAVALGKNSLVMPRTALSPPDFLVLAVLVATLLAALLAYRRATRAIQV